jgi:hypothetical protein
MIISAPFSFIIFSFLMQQKSPCRLTPTGALSILCGDLPETHRCKPMHDDDKQYDDEEKAVAYDWNQVFDGFMVHHVQSRILFNKE